MVTGFLGRDSMQVLVVDDHPIIHEVMRAVLERALKPSVIYFENTLEAAIKRAQRLKGLDLAVLDLGLPGCSKLEAFTRFHNKFPKLAVVVLSAIDSAETIRAALAAGAKGYIPKTSGPQLMQSALRVVAAGGTYVPPEALQEPLETAQVEPIAPINNQKRVANSREPAGSQTMPEKSSHAKIQIKAARKITPETSLRSSG